MAKHRWVIPYVSDFPLQSLRGTSAGRGIRGLCDFRPPYGVRELAGRTRTSAPTLSRVIDLLDREALLTRNQRGVVLTIDWEATIRRWTQDYSFLKSNRVFTFLEPRGLSKLRTKLADLKWAYATTGSFAAALVAPMITAKH